MKILYLPFDGRFQAEVIEHPGPQLGGNLADLADDFVHQPRHFAGLQPQGTQRGQLAEVGEFLFQPGDVHFQTGERLAQFVMHLSGDAGAFLLAHRLQIRRQGAQLFARVLELLFGLLQAGDVARDLGEAEQPALLVPQGGDNNVRLETGTVLAHAPAFVLSATLQTGLLEVLFRLGPSHIQRREKPGQVRPDDFVGPIAQQPFGAAIPTGDLSGGIEHENRVVLDPLHEQTETLLTLVQRLFHPLAFADVTEGQHNAGDIAGGVADGRGAVVDGSFRALARDEHRTIGGPGDDALQQGLGHQAFELLARFGVHGLIHFCQGPARGFGRSPPGQFFSHRIHKRDQSLGVGHHHAEHVHRLRAPRSHRAVGGRT